jgi:hypothetical protein
MKSINWGRVFLGGIVAGLVVNVSEFLLHAVVLKNEMAEWMKSLGRPVPQGGSATVVWLVWGFLFGIAAVWLYAAIRTRYGPGAGTAVKAGFAAWFLMHFLCEIVFVNMGLSAYGNAVLPLAWTLVEAILATVVGAWLYKEDGPAAA